MRLTKSFHVIVEFVAGVQLEFFVEYQRHNYALSSSLLPNNIIYVVYILRLAIIAEVQKMFWPSNDHCTRAHRYRAYL